MRLLIPFVILVGILFASLAAERPRPRADLTTGYISIETLDPQVTRASEDVRIAYALFEGLMTFDNDFNVVPGVAESYTVSDDGLVYTYTLRPDAKWSDGTPVTATTFARSWMLGLLPDTAPPYMEFLHFIKGAKAFTDWGVESLGKVNEQSNVKKKREAAERRVAQIAKKFDELVGVKVVSPTVLEVTLERPTPFFLEISATWPLFPLPLHILEPRMYIDDATMMYRRDPQWIKPGNDPRTMISNGPYMLASWKFRNHVRLEANPHYWDRAIVGPQSVELISFSQHQAMYNAYHSGSLDLILGATPLPYSPELLAAQRAGERDDVHAFDAYGTYYYAFNVRPKLPDGRDNPFVDLRVRKAFALAVNKQRIVESVTRLHQTPTGVFVPVGAIKGYESPKGLGYDPDRARALLREAGYGPGKPFGEVTISYNTGGGHENVAQAVAHMWQSELADFGVKVNLGGSEWKVFLEARHSGDFEIARSGWFGDYTDPTTFLDLFRSGGGHNDPGMADPTYDKMLNEAAAELDPAKRFALLSEAERYLMEEKLPILPLYFYSLIDLYDPERVQNVSNHPRNLQLFHRMRVTPR